MGLESLQLSITRLHCSILLVLYEGLRGNVAQFAGGQFSHSNLLYGLRFIRAYYGKINGSAM